MTLTMLRARLFIVRLRGTVHLTYCAAKWQRANNVMVWEMFKLTLRGIWGIK